MSSASMRAMAFWALIAVSVPQVATAQRTHQPPMFTDEDFMKLEWLSGRWVGTARAGGEKPFYEWYRFVNDSTIEITYASDSGFTQKRGTGRIYLSTGRIYQISGPGRWTVTRLEEHSVNFAPQTNATNSFTWQFQSPEAWTSTVRSGIGGQEQVTIYQMRRIH